MKRESILALVFPLLLATGCTRRPPRGPLETLLGFQAQPVPDLRGLDWGKDLLWKAGGLAVRRSSFEAYLCERFARSWTRVRAVLALFARGLHPGLPEKIRIPEKDVIELRAILAGKVSGGDEKALRRELLSFGWGEVGVLDRLRGRLLVERLAAFSAKKKKALPAGVRKLLSDLLPPLLPPRLEDLETDGRARVLDLLAESKVSFFLERREGGGEILAWAGREPLVKTEEVLVDLLGVLTETERRRAFREYLALRTAENRLGRILRAETGSLPRAVSPARAWMGRARAAFLASPQDKDPRPVLAKAARRAAAEKVQGVFLLVPALRKSSGRPGFPGDQKRALERARTLKEELEGGESPSKVREGILAGLPPGKAVERVREVMDLSGRELAFPELEAALDTPLDGLGLGENPAWSLLLFAKKGEWTLVSTWWGPLLFRLEKKSRIQEKKAALLAPELEGRMRFFAWCRRLLGE